MRVTELTKHLLAFKREERMLVASGYKRHETDSEILRGGSYDKIILDAKISMDGKYVYTKIGKKEASALDKATVEAVEKMGLKAIINEAYPKSAGGLASLLD